MDTTEYVSLTGPTVEGPKLPIHVWGHCFVQLDENTFMLAGGVSLEYYSSAKSFIWNRLTGEWSDGPQMNTDRYLHSCATFDKDGHNVVLASGGYSIQSGMVASAEIYDHMSPDKKWQTIAEILN